MKYLLLFLLFAPLETLACNNFIAQSEIDNAIALVPDTGAVKCTKAGANKCVCFDGIFWQAAVWDGKDLSNDKDKLAAYYADVAAKKAKRQADEATLSALATKIKAGTDSANDLRQYIKLRDGL